MKYCVDAGVLALVYVLVFFKRWRAGGRDVLAVNTLMYLYLSGVLFVTLMPVIASLPHIFSHGYTPMNMVPFIDVTLGRGDFLRQVLLNVVMTVPFGFLLPLTRRGRIGFGRTVLLCFLMSLSIEILQPLISDIRSSDITDIITNVAGAAVGYGIYLVCKPLADAVLARLRTGE